MKAPLRLSVSCLVLMSALSPALTQERGRSKDRPSRKREAAKTPRKEEVFSGPQAGEAARPFTVLSVYGEQRGKETQFLKDDKTAAQLLVFVHKLTRPSVGLGRAITQFTTTRYPKRVTPYIVWLADDLSDADAYLNRARRSLNFAARVGVSKDGADGPGAYGLNREVELTVLVTQKNRVVGNFALVQPSDQDGPRILSSLAKAIGEKAPTAADIALYGRRVDPELRRRVSKLLGKDVKAEEVRAIQKSVESFVEGKRRLEMSLGTLAQQITKNRNFEAETNAEAKQVVMAWQKKYGAMARRMMRGRRRPQANADEGRWRQLLTPIIRKDSSDETVKKAIADVEEFIKDRPERQKNLGNRCVRVTSGKIFREGGYGGKIARAQLKEWAKTYGSEPQRPKR
ncbi:MAG: hypothetical protein AAF517_14705 [Planctomycetota bacterium]